MYPTEIKTKYRANPFSDEQSHLDVEDSLVI